MNERKSARRARWETRLAEEQRDRVLVLAALRGVLQDPEATTEQRIFAVCTLDRMQYYNFVPYGLKPGKMDSDAFIADFAKRLEEYQQETDK